MPKFKPQFRRLLFIDRKIRDKRYPNCTTLATEWEVSTKTIQRDIDYMKYDLEAPIDYDHIKHGFYYTEERFALPAISISESDLFAVVIAERVMKQFRNTPLQAKLASVFGKIQSSLPDTTRVKASWLNERIMVFPEPATVVDPKVWDLLAGAICDNRRVQILHVPPGEKNGTERKVDPYYLVNHKGEWYLSSFCHTRNSIRTFAVSRIKKAVLMPETFVMPADMTMDKMFGDRFGIIWKPDFHKVRIHFTSKIAPYIRERQWHPRQVLKPRKDGGLILEFTTNHLNEVLDWILSWGPDAKVFAPSILVNKVRESLRCANHLYSCEVRKIPLE